MPSLPRQRWSRLVRFIAREDGLEYMGQPCNPEIDVGQSVASGDIVEAYIIEASSPWDCNARLKSTILSIEKLLCPLDLTQTYTVRCCGLSYRDHAEEMKLAIPKVPALFFKPSTSLTHPGASIKVPKICQAQLDWEVELAIIIGKTCKDVSEADAMDYVLGYTAANDLTSRSHQNKTSQWAFSKGFDQFSPLGPCLVSTRALPFPHEVSLTTDVNGERMQEGTAKNMIFTLSALISYLSQGTTMLPGTVILTGTPPGIGAGHSPPRWLQDGDTVRCFISHGIGSLINTIVYE